MKGTRQTAEENVYALAALERDLFSVYVNRSHYDANTRLCTWLCCGLMNMDGVVTMNQRASFQNSSQSISV